MFQSHDHVYKCKVPGYEDTELVVSMSVMPPKEFDAHVAEAVGLTPDARAKLTIEKICSHVKKIEGYITPDGEITDPKELYEKGAPGVWAFIQRAVYNDQILSGAEVKN